MGKKTFVLPSEKTLKEKLASYNKLKGELDTLTAEVKEARTISTPLFKKLNKLSDKVYNLVEDAEELLFELNDYSDELHGTEDLQDLLDEAATNLRNVQKQLS